MHICLENYFYGNLDSNVRCLWKVQPAKTTVILNGRALSFCSLFWSARDYIYSQHSRADPFYFTATCKVSTILGSRQSR